MFIDANIFIYTYDSKSGKEFINSKNQLRRINMGEMKAQTSTLVLNEVLYIISSTQGLDKASRVWKNILALNNIEILSVDKNTLSHVIDFCRTGLETTDAYHAATMKAHGIKTICSYDKGFDGLSSIKRQVPK